MSEVRALILVHNNHVSVERLLQSLDSHGAFSDRRLKIHVLDNGSTDPDLPRILASYPEVAVDRVEQNLGVAGGRQWQLDHLSPCQYFLFLDSDVVIADDRWLDALLNYMSHENYGVIGPGGAFVDFDLPQLYTPAIAGAQCDVVAGFCQLCRYELLAAGAKFDQQYNPYWSEDSDFCLTAYECGFDIWCTMGVGVAHIPSTTNETKDGHDRNTEYFIKKWKDRSAICKQGAW